MGLKTPLFDQHKNAGGKIVDFAGWDMPLNYGSQLEEHRIVRTRAGVFDVSHMRGLDVHGNDSRRFLERLLANDVQKLQSPGKALYSCLLNNDGGVLDDLIVYFLDAQHFRIVVNAATAANDIAWMNEQACDFDVRISPCEDIALLAVQGPAAREMTAPILPPAVREQAMALKPFSAYAGADYFIARTGYTGEDGWEIAVPAKNAGHLWAQLLEAGVHPCGLGARDTLRLEAGLNLYGSDMDETTTPFESNLGWTVSLERPERKFIGRAALQDQLDSGVPRRLVGLILLGKGILRGGQGVSAALAPVGEICSGGFAPTLGRSIALARIDADAGTDDLSVDIRGRDCAVQVCAPPFVRNGKVRVALPQDD